MLEVKFVYRNEVLHYSYRRNSKKAEVLDNKIQLIFNPALSPLRRKTACE